MLSSHLAFSLRALRILHYICPLWKSPGLEYVWSLGAFSLMSTESSLLTIMCQTSRKSVIKFCAIHNLPPVVSSKLFRAVLPVISRYLNVHWLLKFSVSLLLFFFWIDDAKIHSLNGLENWSHSHLSYQASSESTLFWSYLKLSCSFLSHYYYLR